MVDDYRTQALLDQQIHSNPQCCESADTSLPDTGSHISFRTAKSESVTDLIFFCKSHIAWQISLIYLLRLFITSQLYI